MGAILFLKIMSQIEELHDEIRELRKEKDKRGNSISMKKGGVFLTDENNGPVVDKKKKRRLEKAVAIQEKALLEAKLQLEGVNSRLDKETNSMLDAVVPWVRPTYLVDEIVVYRFPADSKEFHVAKIVKLGGNECYVQRAQKGKIKIGGEYHTRYRFEAAEAATIPYAAILEVVKLNKNGTLPVKILSKHNLKE